MKRIKKTLVSTAFMLFGAVGAAQAQEANSVVGQLACEGKFLNPITDICWSCVYPIRLFGANIFQKDGEDFDTGFNSVACACENPPQIGVPNSFWEPVYLTDVTTVPWCFPLLGGVHLNVPINATKLGFIADRTSTISVNSEKSSFQWVHGYTNPLMYVLDVLLDSSCLTKGSLSPEWPTEVDPAYDDWEISTAMNPLVFAVANMTAVAAGTADGIAALVDFPRPELFWVAGSWGNIYPYSGFVDPHHTNETTARLLTTRLLAWQHEFKAMSAMYGSENACSDHGSWQPIMDKRQYKITRVWPVPQTKKIMGRCCDPIGRTTMLIESGMEVPAPKYRDFGYAIFRKRDCCSGAWP